MRAAFRVLLLLAPLILGLAGCSAASGCTGSQSCTRVLFIGNSYTYVNDLPTMFASLAGSGGHAVETGLLAQGGWSLSNHLAAPVTAKTLTATPWNVVVLQEQSEIPSIESVRQSQMYPAARRLVQSIRAAGEKPLFFLTWGHRDGWPEEGIGGYAPIQTALDQGYVAIATELHAGIAPVGDAWSVAVERPATSALWQDDGNHPTVAGTYLAACVFYAAVFKQTPVGLSEHAGLSSDEAAMLQQIAAATVLPNRARWGLA